MDFTPEQSVEINKARQAVVQTGGALSQAALSAINALVEVHLKIEREQTGVRDVGVEEGDSVFLRAKVYRANDEQALIEFNSMGGLFSIQVPISELVNRVTP